MKILSHNEIPDIDTNTVKFQEIIDANYKDIVKVFGEPLEGDLYKTDTQWKLKLVPESGKLSYTAVLYNFKTGENYLKEDGLPLEDIPHWNVSTSNSNIDAAAHIEKFIRENARK